MARIQRDTLLGLVFFGTLAFLLWATVNLTDISLTGVPPMRVWFEDANSIREGDPVLLRGMRVGRVDSIAYVPERPEYSMLLVLRLDRPVQLTDRYVIEIRDSSVLGGKQVYIDPGRGAPLPESTELRGSSAANPLAAAGRFFEGTGPTGTELQNLLAQLGRFARQLNEPDSTIGALTQRRDLYDEVLESVKGIHRLLTSVEEGEGILGRIVKDRTLRDDAMRLVGNLADLSERLKGTEGLVPRLINDRTLADSVTQTVTTLEAIVTDLRAGRGPLGRVLSDDAMGQQLADAVASLASVLRKADDPQAGIFGSLFGDPTLREEFALAVGHLRSILHSIDEGQGTLALLINDEDMGLRLRRIFTQVSRALEDAREAAPIANFVQVLFGAF